MHTLFSSEYLVIHYDQVNRYLALQWTGIISSKLFRDLATLVLAAIKETGAKKIISDNSQWKVISPNDYAWAADFWFPKAEEYGVKQLATVQSNNIFHSTAQREIESMAGTQDMQIENFKSMEDAIAWINKTGQKRLKLLSKL